MRVYETQLPGIGVRYTLRFENGHELVVLARNDGVREVFWRETSDADATPLFELTEETARRVANILNGTYFHPVEDGIEGIFEDARIRWIHIDSDSPIADRTIGEVGIRSRSGVTILGIRRDETTLSDVTAQTRIQPDDVLVAVGSEEDHAAFRDLLNEVDR